MTHQMVDKDKWITLIQLSREWSARGASIEVIANAMQSMAAHRINSYQGIAADPQRYIHDNFLTTGQKWGDFTINPTITPELWSEFVKPIVDENHTKSPPPRRTPSPSGRSR